MSRRRLAAWALLAFVASALVPANGRAGKPGIDEFEVRREADRVLVSYRLRDCLQEETRERIESGIPIQFKHKIEIVERRPGLFSRDRVHSKTIVETRVQYDSLTERYELTRLTELKSRRKQPELAPLEQRAQSTAEDEMVRWLTEVVDAPVFAPESPEPLEYYVRVEVSIGRKWFLLILPTSHTVQLERPAEFGD